MTVLVTIRHARKARICALGCKRFLRDRGMDVRAFFKGPGLPADELRKLDHAMVNRVVAVAEAEAEEEARG